MIFTLQKKLVIMNACYFYSQMVLIFFLHETKKLSLLFSINIAKNNLECGQVGEHLFVGIVVDCTSAVYSNYL